MTEQVPLVEAAARLGLTPDALRMRLRRGQVAGRQDGRRWFVLFPTEQPPVGTEQEHVTTEQPSEQPAPAAGELAGELRARVAFLEAELVRKDATLERAQLALNREQEIVLRLTAQLAPRAQLAPVDTTLAAPERPENRPAGSETATEPPGKRRPWWRLW